MQREVLKKGIVNDVYFCSESFSYSAWKKINETRKLQAGSHTPDGNFFEINPEFHLLSGPMELVGVGGGLAQCTLKEK